MSTATLMTVVESFTSRDGQLTATVLYLADAYVVDLDDVQTGQAIERVPAGSDVAAALRLARSLAWGEPSAEDEAEDAMLAAVLATPDDDGSPDDTTGAIMVEVARTVAAWKAGAPVPTPVGVSGPAPLATPTAETAPLQASAPETAPRPVNPRSVAWRRANRTTVDNARILAVRLDTLRNANQWADAAQLEREMGEFARSHGLGSSWVDVYNV